MERFTVGAWEATRTISRKTYLFVAALFVFLAASVPVDAQDVTCGWCTMHGDLVDSGPGWAEYENVTHAFPGGGNECGWDGRNDESIVGGPVCARCGGTSDCHTEEQDGICHIACGPLGDLFSALTDVEEALESGDMIAVASALRQQRTGVFFEFIPEGGRIDVVLACDPDSAYDAIPVLPEARGRLQAALGLHTGSSAE